MVEDGGVNVAHIGDPRFDTADFSDAPPPARATWVDSVLPSRHPKVRRGGVLWPTEANPLVHLVGDDDPHVGGPLSSDHRLVWPDFGALGRH